MNEDFEGQGFVYWDETISPDGRFRLLNGYRDGEKTPTFIEPRIIDALSGQILVDLWHTYQNYEADFSAAGKITLRIQDSYQTKSRVVEIDLVQKTFAFEDSPQTRAPLSRLREQIRLK